MRRIAAASAAVCLSLLAAGCGGDPVRDPSDNVAFTPCSQVECAGTLSSGADFDIIMPDDWNGTLAIFSHGLHRIARESGEPVEPSAAPQSPAPTTRDGTTSPDGTQSGTPSPGEASSQVAEPSPSEGSASPSASPRGRPTRSPDSPEPDPSPSPTTSPSAPIPRRGGPELAPRWAQGDRAIADVMLQAGYAIAGAAPARTGWSVPEQVTAAEELHDYFAEQIGEPNRVYVWGESTGGLASALLAEQRHDWVSGALAMCAPLSGPVRSYNLALDVGYAVRQLLAPRLQLTSFTSLDQARQARDRAIRLVRRAAEGSREQQAKVVFIAAVGVLPNRTREYDGTTLDSQIRANVVGIENLLEQATVERYQLEVDAGGNPSGNAGTDYASRISDAQRQQIDSLVSGAVDRFLEELQSDRIVSDPAAAERAAEMGDPSGELGVPVLTLHNAFDPVYVVQNESAFAQTVAAVSAEAQGNLVHLTVFPPTRFNSATPADEGAGNCNFSPRTLFGAVNLLNRWVRGGQYPGQDSMAESFRGQRVTLDHDLPPWPQMSGQAPASEPGPTPAGEGTDQGATAKVAKQSPRARAADPGSRSGPGRER